jgi:hypothetical protein
MSPWLNDSSSEERVVIIKIATVARTINESLEVFKSCLLEKTKSAAADCNEERRIRDLGGKLVSSELIASEVANIERITS